MSRVFNFSAGPAMVPEAVLKQAQADMLNFSDNGMSVMEMSHRGKTYISIAEQAEADLRAVMGIPNNYKVLFLQGGASSQFAMIALNLMHKTGKADYVNSGQWSKKAIAEAKRYGEVHIAASSEANGFTDIPDPATWDLSPDAAYVHYTPNETIAGVECFEVPDTADIPLVADMSSTILSRPMDVSKFGIIYAGAQKNIGPAGLTIVIIRDDLIGDAQATCPAMFNYETHVKGGSMANTPPTYSWYLAGLVFQWLKDKGGLNAIEKVNRRKAAKLYKAIDDSPFYANPVAIKNRSLMNIPFTLKNAGLDAEFLAGAAKKGLVTLKGHRSMGGMRASIYNAMPEEGVDSLVAYMAEFAAIHAG